MFRFLIDSEAGDPDSFAIPFPGGEVSLKNPKQLFILSPSHVAVPFNRATAAAIARTIPFFTPAPVTFLTPSFTRASIATVVNSQGLVETVPADAPRFDHDPVTLAPKGLLLKESRTNLLPSFTPASWVPRFVNIPINGAVSPTGSANATTVIATNKKAQSR
jgi:hypothetical protein